MSRNWTSDLRITTELYSPPLYQLSYHRYLLTSPETTLKVERSPPQSEQKVILIFNLNLNLSIHSIKYIDYYLTSTIIRNYSENHINLKRSLIVVFHDRSSLIMPLDIVPQLLTHLFPPTEQHHSILLEKQGIVNIRIPSSHCPLINDHIFRPPHFQHRHTCNRTVRIFQCRRVHNIISTDNQHHIRLREVLVDLLHF